MHSFMMAAADSRRVCYKGQPLRRANGRTRMSGRTLWFVACVGAATFLLSPVAHALRHQAGNGFRAKGLEKPQEVEAAVCKEDVAKQFTASLSEAKRKVSLECAGQQPTAVPELTKGFVCPTGISSLAECKMPTEDLAGGKKAVSLSELMGGTVQPPVTWVDGTPTETDGKKYELSFPDAPLPLLDSEFVTGCKAASGNECKLTVTVEARKSAAAGQTVYCAYGKLSNEAKSTVTMTQQNNTLTLICGNEAINAVPQPAEYKTDYCADDKVGADCTKEKFTSFIPGFQSTWWTENKGAHNVTLKIPPEHFPDSPKTIHLGCLYTPPSPPAAAISQNAQATNQNLCKVDVVISAKESSATSSTVAALPGLAVAAVVFSISFLM